MIRQASRGHNPQEFERKKANSSLEGVAQLRAEAAMETRDYLMDLARHEALASNLEPIDRRPSSDDENRQADDGPSYAIRK